MSLRPTFISAFAACTLLAATASAEDAPSYFENDVLHFEMADGVLVSSTDVNGVEVIMAQGSNALSGAAEGNSFVSISIYRNECTVDECADRVLTALETAFEDTSTRNGNTLTIRYGEVEARGEVDAIDAGDGTVVITYAQFDRNEQSAALAQLLPTLELGPVPSDAPAEDNAAEDEHDEDNHEGGH